MPEGLRDILLPMNYRRGFRRLYIVLSLAWIVGVVLVMPWPSRHGIYDLDSAHKAGYSDTNIVQYLRSARGLDTEQSQALEELLRRRARGELSPKEDTRLKALIKQPSQATRLLIIASWTFVPPIAAYLILFYVVPWICRGFRPATQI